MRDHDSQQLAYVYFENEPGRRSAAKLLTKERRIAANIAKPAGAVAPAMKREAEEDWGTLNPMSGPHSNKALNNESRYPYVVELALPHGGLEIELNGRIVGFHKSRHIEPRHGRQIIRDNRTYSRWCFSDLATARDFVEQFGGMFYKIIDA